MDDEWNTVKDKKKTKPKRPQNVDSTSYGGKTAKGTLIAGPVQQSSSKYGGGDSWGGSSR